MNLNKIRLRSINSPHFIAIKTTLTRIVLHPSSQERDFPFKPSAAGDGTVGPKDAISELKHFINSSSATRKWQMKGTFRPSKSDKLLNTTKTPSNMMLNRGKGAHAVEN